jgi:PST family polysaccharide transporter
MRQAATEAPAGPKTPKKGSHGEILKSSALIGFSTLINIAIGIVRTKAMAVWLGPADFGLMGLYGSIADFAQTLAGMGVNASGVRQIAAAAGEGDTDRIARAVVVLRRTAVFLGLFGAALVVVFSRPISDLTFGSNQHATAVKALSAIVLFGCLSGAQTAFVQGMRRVSDLVKMGILSATLGAIVSLSMVYAFREEGIVPALICGAAMSLIVSWSYSRKVQIRTPSLTLVEIGREAADLLKLGFAMMASGLMMTGASYAIRVFILHQLGFEAAGLYQSAWALAGMCVGVILGAMGTDFYPRLTAAAEDNVTCNRLVNEQTQVGILLAAPGVIATLTLASLVLTMFYSSKFQDAVDVLRWLCLGMALRVISWPMGYIIIAKGARNLLFWSECVWTAVYVALAWVCLAAFGLNGAGAAFFAAYVVHVLMVYVIARKLSGFAYSPANMRLSLMLVLSIGTVFFGFYGMPYPIAMVIGVLTLGAASAFSIREVLDLVSRHDIPRPVLEILVWFGLLENATLVVDPWE